MTNVVPFLNQWGPPLLRRFVQQLKQQLMEGRRHGPVRTSGQMQEVEHVSRGNSPIWVDKTTSHIKQLNMAESRKRCAE